MKNEIAWIKILFYPSAIKRTFNNNTWTMRMLLIIAIIMVSETLLFIFSFLIGYYFELEKVRVFSPIQSYQYTFAFESHVRA